MKPTWDVIIVGARVAGATLAGMLGAAGLRVLLLDRACFPTDLAQQAAWDTTANRVWDEMGALKHIEAVGAPRQTAHYSITDTVVVPYTYEDLGDFSFRMSLRRITLDTVLSQYAAAFPSVELRTDYPACDLIMDGDRVVGIKGGKPGQSTTETATLVVGADGRHSWLARQIRAETYEILPSGWASYIAYYSGTQVQPGVGHYARLAASRLVLNVVEEGLVIANVGVREAEVDTFRRQLPQSFETHLYSHPHFREALAGGKRENAIGGACRLKMYQRVPYGPGWALVGDAGYHLDPVGARGVTAAVISARLLTNAILAAVCGKVPLDMALHQYHHLRDERLNDEWQFTARMLAQEPPDEADRAQARLLSQEPTLRRLQMKAVFGYCPMSEFYRALEKAQECYASR